MKDYCPNKNNKHIKAEFDELVKAVEAAGYGASLKGKEKTASSGDAPAWADAEALKDHETPKLKKRLMFSVPILLILMYFSMGHMMWGWPAPAAFDNHVFLGLFELLLAVAVMIINGKFFSSGFSNVRLPRAKRSGGSTPVSSRSG